MTVRELIAELSKYPQDALVGLGNWGITDVDSLPAYYDGRHQCPKTDDQVGFHIRYCIHGDKVQLKAQGVEEYIDDRFPLYTPLLAEVYDPATKTSHECDWGLELRYPDDPNYKNCMVRGFADHYPKPITNWDEFWDALCDAYEIKDGLTSHERMLLQEVEQKHRPNWINTPAEGEPHLTYRALGAIAYDLMAKLPQARKAAQRTLF